MNAKMILAIALFLGSLLGGLIAASSTRLADDLDAPSGDTIELAMIACAGGYHADRSGNCQPDHGIVDSRCQDGFEAAPSPSASGYRCDPIPQGY